MSNGYPAVVARYERPAITDLGSLQELTASGSLLDSSAHFAQAAPSLSGVSSPPPGGGTSPGTTSSPGSGLPAGDVAGQSAGNTPTTGTSAGGVQPLTASSPGAGSGGAPGGVAGASGGGGGGGGGGTEAIPTSAHGAGTGRLPFTGGAAGLT